MALFVFDVVVSAPLLNGREVYFVYRGCAIFFGYKHHHVYGRVENTSIKLYIVMAKDDSLIDGILRHIHHVYKTMVSLVLFSGFHFNR